MPLPLDQLTEFLSDFAAGRVGRELVPDSTQEKIDYLRSMHKHYQKHRQGQFQAL